MVGRSPAVNRGLMTTALPAPISTSGRPIPRRRGDKHTSCIFLAVHARQSQQDPMYHLKPKDWIIEPVAISVPAVRGSIISAKATAINPKLMQWAHSGFLSHSVLLSFSVNCSSNQRMRPAQLIDQLLRELTKSPELPVQPLVQAFLCGVWVTLRKGLLQRLLLVDVAVASLHALASDPGLSPKLLRLHAGTGTSPHSAPGTHDGSLGSFDDSSPALTFAATATAGSTMCARVFPG